MTKKTNDYVDIEISKVQLTNYGQRGSNIIYKKIDEVCGNSFANTFKPEMKYPVHEALLKNFSWLKLHLLSICGYKEHKYTVEQVEVTCVELKGNAIIIEGELDTLGSGKVVPLQTFKVTNADEYYLYDDVIKIIYGIFEETKVYLSKAVTMQAVEYVIRENRHNPEFNEESFRALSEEQQAKWHKKYLAKNKLIAISEEEIMEMKDMDELVFLKGHHDEEEEKSGGQIEGEIKLADVEAELILEVTETPTIIPSRDDDGEINLEGIVTKREAVKVSTAKKIEPIVANNEYLDLE